MSDVDDRLVEALVILILALAKAVQYWWIRRQGFSRKESLFPSIIRKPPQEAERDPLGRHLRQIVKEREHGKPKEETDQSD